VKREHIRPWLVHCMPNRWYTVNTNTHTLQALMTEKQRPVHVKAIPVFRTAFEESTTVSYPDDEKVNPSKRA
jgi:hypothetical protein